MEELMIKIDNVSKMYKLGQIGGTTLRDELQRKRAKLRGEEDPTRKIGSKNYNTGETFMALNGISFEVKKGERVGIIGHNGAGKSTLLKLLSRVTAPTSGEIGLNGRVASMLEVGTGFHGELTGRENIYMNGAILGMTKKEIDAKMEDIIEFSECRQFIDTPVKRYSSGMYVKLAFSVAAHLDSEILIMDEVLAVGDMAFQKKCLDKMNDVSRKDGRTILYVSHNMNTIRQLCERVIVLDHGKIMFDGDTEKGIALYLNVKEDASETEVDLTQLFHEKQYNKNIDFKCFSVVGKKSCSFINTEKLKFVVKYDVLPPEEKDVSFRVAIKNEQYQTIGMCQSEKFDLKVGNDQEIKVEFDLSLLREGKYYVSIGIFYIETEDVPEGIEAMGSVFSFNIEPDPYRKKKFRWRSDIFGSIEFPLISIER